MFKSPDLPRHSRTQHGFNNSWGEKRAVHKIQFTGAKLVRTLQGNIGYPSTKSFLKIVDVSLLKNFPVMRSDIVAAKDMFGTNVESFKGKTTRKTSNRVKGNYSVVPPAIIICRQNVTLAADIMFVVKIPFLIA